MDVTNLGRSKMRINSTAQFNPNLIARRQGESVDIDRLALRRRERDSSTDAVKIVVRTPTEEGPAVATYDRRRRAAANAPSEDRAIQTVNTGVNPKIESRGKPKEGVFGDLDNNSIVDGTDLGLLLGNYGTDNAASDLDKNGRVDQDDIDLLNKAFTKKNPETEEAKKTKFGDLDGDSIVDGKDLGLLLGNFGSSDGVGDLDKNGSVDQGDLDLILEAFKRGLES